eukprot:353224-Pleurochrysis_carterae.AAC.1
MMHFTIAYMSVSSYETVLALVCCANPKPPSIAPLVPPNVVSVMFAAVLKQSFVFICKETRMSGRRDVSK